MFTALKPTSNELFVSIYETRKLGTLYTAESVSDGIINFRKRHLHQYLKSNKVLEAREIAEQLGLL